MPPALLFLPALQVLDLSHNDITTIDFSSPIAPSDQGLSYGAGFLSTSFSRASSSKGPKTIFPILRSLNLGFNALGNVSLSPLGKLRALRVLNLETNKINGTLDLKQIGLDDQPSSELASLVLSGNAGLQGMTGNVRSGCKVETVGCSIFRAPADITKGSSKSTIASSANSSLLVPLPTLTLIYRTLPAATFDSLPLDIEFDLYLPPTPSIGSGHPLVIWFHGGGLLQGSKENLPPHFRRLPCHDYGGESVAVISPNYRLAPQVPILDILDDVTVLLSFVRTKLNDKLGKTGESKQRIDTSRICVSGGSAGGYLALMAGLEMPTKLSAEELGGYRGDRGIKCIAPFYPITDLLDKFWATKVDPVPWMTTRRVLLVRALSPLLTGHSVTHEEAKPHLDLKSAPIATSIPGGPRSILYPYMLQHALFPSLLFLKQKSVGAGLDSFRPEPRTLSITHRLSLLNKPRPPIYLIYGTADSSVQPFEKTVAAMRRTEGVLEVEMRDGIDHGFDEDAAEECIAFRHWLGKHLI